jgi:hypothetical protein
MYIIRNAINNKAVQSSLSYKYCHRCMIHWGVYWPRTVQKVVQYSLSHETNTAYVVLAYSRNGLETFPWPGFTVPSEMIPNKHIRAYTKYGRAQSCPLVHVSVAVRYKGVGLGACAKLQGI